MRLVRTVLGLIVASGLIVGVSACGGDDKASPLAGDTPPATPASTSPPVTPTPVNPTAAAKAKVLADYQEFLAFRTRGMVSNSASYPYEQVLTGNALQTAKSYTSGMKLVGNRFSGSYKYIKGSVVALNLKVKPATATVQACATDAVILKNKAGKALTKVTKVATNDELVLTGGRWKVTESTTTDATGEGCKQ